MANTVTREELLHSDVVRQQIAERAYFISEKQGFAPGREEEHWYTAEAETLQELLSSNGAAANGVEKKPRVRKAAPKAEVAPQAEVAPAAIKAAAAPRKTTRKKAS